MHINIWWTTNLNLDYLLLTIHTFTPHKEFIHNSPTLAETLLLPQMVPLLFLWCFSFCLCLYLGRSHAGGYIVQVAMCLWWQGLKDPKLGLNSIYSCIWPWIVDFPESTPPVKGSQTLLLKYSIELGKIENITLYLHLLLREAAYSHVCQMLASLLYWQ